MLYKSLKFSFSNHLGQKLSGLLDLPAEPPLFYGVFAPCFNCTKESHAAHKLGRAFAACGIALLRFDLTGLGESAGDFSESNFSTRILDITAACHALAAACQPPAVLVGHSISGTASFAAAPQVPGLRALVTLGSPRDQIYILDQLKHHRLIHVEGDRAEMIIAGRRISVKKNFIDDTYRHDMSAVMAHYDRKLFIFHAPHDEIVSFDHAQIIYDRATCDKELIPLGERATHLLEQGDEEAAFMAEVVSQWLKTHYS